MTCAGLVTGSPTLGTPTVTIAGAFSPVGVTLGAPSLGHPSLTQVHGLTPSGVTTGAASLGHPTLTRVYLVSPAGFATGTPTLGNPTLTVSAAVTRLEVRMDAVFVFTAAYEVDAVLTASGEAPLVQQAVAAAELNVVGV